MSANFLKNYMDLDEFLAVKDLCTGLSRTESDYAEEEIDEDILGFNDEEGMPLKYSLSQFNTSSTPQDSATPSLSDVDNSDTDEGRGESICSFEFASCSSSESLASINFNENDKAPKRKKRKHVTHSEKPAPKKKRRKTSDDAKNGTREAVQTNDEINVVANDCLKGVRPRNGRQLVEECSKDEKYWERRRKNNQAAKRSRDLKREKEMNVKEKAAFLEEENKQLREEVQKLKEFLKTLDEKVEK